MIYSLDLDRGVFAAQRRQLLEDSDRTALTGVNKALRQYGQAEWWEPALDAAERIFRRVVRGETHTNKQPDLPDAVREFRDVLARTLQHTREPTTPRVTSQLLARWLSTAAVNAATAFVLQSEGRDGVGKEWVSMHDDHVRPTHVEADGQVVRINEKFRVDDHWLDYPGQPIGPPAIWINCRCVARPAELGAAMTSTDQGNFTVGNANSLTLTTSAPQAAEVPVEDPDEEYDFQPVPWHAVLAPEGVVSGDKRRFSKEALTWRDLPLPLSWQKVSDEKHKGSVIVGHMDKVWRDGNLLHASGIWDQSPEADEAFRLVVERHLRGVSVDVDDATLEFQNEDGGPAGEGEEGIATFTAGRICGATLVAIPAFQEAFIQVGEPVTAAAEGSWDGSASRFTPEQYRRSCVLHKCAGLSKDCHSLPIREPGGAINRQAVHSATAAINGARGGVKGASASQIAAAKSALRAAYRALGEDVPESLAITDVDVFGRGPGWITNPKATKRLHDYWVHGPGAAKIRWGEPNDFYRCRDQVGEEIGENSPEKLRFINQICAQWHHDAIGMWPGRPLDADTETGTPGPAAVIASAVSTAARRADFFTDPNLVGPSPIVVSREGRIFGHLATWGTCHIGISNACITAPQSHSQYAYFHTGAVDLDDGRTISVGHVTLGGGHADRFAGYQAAVEHYDETGCCVADVIAGEDDYGIWLSGQVRPDVSDESLAALRGAALSGDWRLIGNGLELVAALCVNVPGFPIPRAELAVSGGVQTSLVAAGALEPRQDDVPGLRARLASAVADELELRDRQRRMAKLRAANNRDRIAALRS